MLIFGQKACILGPTIFEIPRPNGYYYCYARSLIVKCHESIMIYNLYVSSA